MLHARSLALLLAATLCACTGKQEAEPAAATNENSVTESCERHEVRDQPSKFVECLFYGGTQGFREKNYGVAFSHWKRLAELPPLPADLEHHRTNAWSNLGYLYHMGWGAPKNPAIALDYWKHAYDRGHEEAAYHLCHSYADRDEPQYDRMLARAYCNEALRRYESLKYEDKEVIGQLRDYLAKLKG